MSAPFRQHTEVLSKSPATAHGLAGRSPESAKWGGLSLLRASCPAPFGAATLFALLLQRSGPRFSGHSEKGGSATAGG
jgi:hypothetical protein